MAIAEARYMIQEGSERGGARREYYGGREENLRWAEFELYWRGQEVCSIAVVLFVAAESKPLFQSSEN